MASAIGESDAECGLRFTQTAPAAVVSDWAHSCSSAAQSARNCYFGWTPSVQGSDSLLLCGQLWVWSCLGAFCWCELARSYPLAICIGPLHWCAIWGRWSLPNVAGLKTDWRFCYDPCCKWNGAVGASDRCLEVIRSRPSQLWDSLHVRAWSFPQVSAKHSLASKVFWYSWGSRSSTYLRSESRLSVAHLLSFLMFLCR